MTDIEKFVNWMNSDEAETEINKINDFKRDCSLVNCDACDGDFFMKIARKTLRAYCPYCREEIR